jgi:selenocysteine lyase/cysteine desulfurase
LRHDGVDVPADASAVNVTADDAERLRILRETLTATGAGIYLATHLAGPMSAESMAALRESDELELRLGRVGPDRPADLALREQEARAALAAIVGAPFGEIVLAHGTADGARAVALACLGLASSAAGGRIIVVDGVLAPLREAVASAAAAAHASVEEVASPPDILAPGVVLVVMAHVSALGELVDPVPVGAAARRVGARLLLDASLSAGALPIRVAETGADAIVADTQRWLLGPEAMALVWVSPALGEGLPARLAAATGPFGRGDLLATARSAGWLLMYVGLPWLQARTIELARRLRVGLEAIDGVEVLGHPARQSALLVFRIDGWPAPEAADELSHRALAITDPEADGELLRVSVGAWNREEELERFVAAVAELAGTTPATLPRRPTLTVIGGPLADPET